MKTAFLVALPIAPMPVGSVYKKGEQLPMHCTLMQWFTTRFSGSRLDLVETQLQDVAKGINVDSIALVAGERALYGPKRDVPVRVLVPSTELQELHTELLIRITRLGLSPESLQWAGAGYSAHVANVNARNFEAGRTHTPESMVLVIRGEDGSKHVTREFAFA